MDLAPILTAETINQNLRHMEFPWPSLVVSRGNEIEKEIRMGKKFPFDEVIHAHAGDPQGMGQKPVTFFFQQIVSLCINPNLLQSNFFPSDVKQRAVTILENCRGNTIGACSDCAGMKLVRQQVARFIQQRDGIPATYGDIFLSNGATDALRIVLYLFSNSTDGKPTGVMVPIPQYPLFSSTVTEYGMYQISYYLNEEKQWALDVKELQRAIDESKAYCEPKVLVIINPGNPSGFVMSREDIENIIKFAYEENLFILADEVYQYNVYDPDLKFHSFKKIMSEMGPPYSSMELSSFMSASKGYMGECGSRSGYCEIVNLDPEIKEMLFKLLSARLCPSLLGQIMMYCITNPPQCNEPSYELFEKEKNNILQSLKDRAEYCYEKFNSIEGSSKSFEQNLRPDEFYAMELLLNSGVCVVPGCLFGQKPQTYHFRLTFLPQMDKLKIIVERILKFHKKFMEEYRG
ncbi:alanine aminotransferase 2 [Caerostris extrusa]|uniref:alanine transaminase n=1 Tax=Caerostris extrusa TaxID=172846 RepID=A0AAV4XM83_CAEEX|nr:alanine aminotransferase 2 [Caerostris extrusa]